MSIEIDKQSKERAHLDGMYLKCSSQTQELEKILSEMDEALAFLYNNPPRPQTQKAIKDILAQRAHGEMLLDMSKQAMDFIGNAIKEEQ
tara:strand:+ start:245 stop:511 length:267 start_codon:yes stop_codon:yes gene_type:complete